MAKRNSTKTATKEAWSASEPRIISFGQWQGINIKEAPLGWRPLTKAPGDSDLPDNFLMLQNNVVTTSIRALETRLDTLPVCTPPEFYVWDEFTPKLSLAFTGIVHLHEDKLFCAFETIEHAEQGIPTDPGGGGGDGGGGEIHPLPGEDDDGIVALEEPPYITQDIIDNVLFYYELDNKDNGDERIDDASRWHRVKLDDADRPGNSHLEITSIYTYGEFLIVMTRYQDEALETENPVGEIFVGRLDDLASGVHSAVRVPNPTTPPTLTPMGELGLDENPTPVSRVTVVYTYVNQFGSTLASRMSTINLNYSPVEFNAGRFLHISGPVTQDVGITGVDMYCAIDENQDMIFIGHVNVTGNASEFHFNWLGSLNDTTQWTSVSLTVPTSNDTKGVDATHVRAHDGRLYFWGGSIPNRLYIGGDPGNELSVARGVGGAFVDIDPGTGLYISATHKFKTYNGASIVTIMCGNKNTNAVKRFNLLETQLTVTNELQAKGYEVEEVPNVIGCNSMWGSGVWADGLYALSRYGLGVTTQQMEESNTLRVQYVSDAIQPVFTDRISTLLSNARMMFCDDVIYFVLAVPGRGENMDHLSDPHTGLDKVIMCYDLGNKAWYTMTYEVPDTDVIRHVFNFDYERWWEGIGIVTPQRIDRIPLTGPRRDVPPDFTALIETGELGLRLPPQLYVWLAQLEFRFDYLVGDLEIDIYGRDYYGRHYNVHQDVSTKRADGTYKVEREYPVWIRVDKNVQTYRITIKGKAHFRLTNFMSKTYQQSDKMALVYGYDSLLDYYDRDGDKVDDHHYLESYNNLREAIVT